MRKFFLFSLFLLVCSFTASATVVTYGTAGCFQVGGGCVNGPAGTSSQITFGNVIMTYFGIASSSVDTGVINPTNGSLGDIILSCVGGGTACTSSSPLANTQLVITIYQTAPAGGGSGNIGNNGVLTGSVTGTASNLQITWNLGAATVTLPSTPPIRYGVANSPLGLVPPSNNNCGIQCGGPGQPPAPGGDTTVQGIITDLGVPEPATLSFIGFGLLALGLTRRFKS